MSEQQPEKTVAPVAEVPEVPEIPEAPESQPVTTTAAEAPKDTVPAPEAHPETHSEPKAEPAADVAAPLPAVAEAPAEAEDTAAAEQPEPEPAAEQQPEKPAYLAQNPALGQFFDRLPAILSATGHEEMWGVSLKDSDDVPTVNVLIKFLRANEGNVKLAEEQLTKALKWRQEMNPTALVESATYNAAKFGGLGYLTTYKDANGAQTVVTWNIYGGVKDMNKTFGDMDEFVKWRVALMEMAVKELKMAEATSVIEYDGEDPYQMLQVHDYLNVSFLRLNPAIKAATKKTIEVFTTAYPELLREKFFVNVPAIMGWMFAAMKVFLSKNTTRKFHPISNGANLAREFPALKDQFPKAYGGGGPALQDGARTVNLVQEPEAVPVPAPAPAPAPAAAEPAPQEEAKEESKEEPKAEPVAEPAKADAAVTTQEAATTAEAK
ncbi:CRAL/TRIO domain protein [Aspergillus clavatus NRRL 1]|uniref:Phosphatidylinositol transfer protein sfh5 n=1 Tax=Aspergillus clavatus (strain ATCC 1007 / CBS 513.65 / DSM 816 / NCTC 3887 / NRRL 1 / QM 1276 / 107) TaxID=344612 RepID=SFH5_ASPCL|nr:CRAL/TRIO domain protein [Aspergillus clavatus NRRL 1]A1C4X0.1 RecName: Full=Phosphatidylinositol transfer protein sfh5; Short=PITP sfh5 [Aspergillus clavatus NRRL 1]EAW14738.1 CRAL/TRIO domain protein [Aspergillus clavatus NRRL 1]